MWSAVNGGQDFMRVHADSLYGIPPAQVIGTAGGTKYGYAKNGKSCLTKEAKLLLHDNNAGKPEGIPLMIGRRLAVGAEECCCARQTGFWHEG